MSPRTAGQWMAIGVAIGTALGVAMKNIPVGVGLGVAMGALMGARKGRGTPAVACAPGSRLFPWIGVAWFLVAILIGASGWLLVLAPPRPQLLIVGLTATLILAGALVPSFRAWLSVVALRSVIALHLARFIGIYFLMLYARGLLPFQFAFVGGWGDIAIAVTAVLWLVLAREPGNFPTLLMLWNVAGIFDIVFVVLTAARLATADPASMAPLRTLPLSLLPTFLVPLIIASHVLIFWRLRRLSERVL